MRIVSVDKSLELIPVLIRHSWPSKYTHARSHVNVAPPAEVLYFSRAICKTVSKSDVLSKHKTSSDKMKTRYISMQYLNI